jgi:hypothetical protein
MPTPNQSESREDFAARCISIVLEDGTAADQDQAVAVCGSMWDDSHKAQEMVRDYIVGEFRGNYPTIAPDPRVDLSALTAGDDAPLYVTLPVGKVGKVSSNGLHYDDTLVQAIQDQIVGRGGVMGHIKTEDRDTAFPIEAVDWIGTTRQGDTLWGKGYIPPGDAREYVRRLKARGGQLATSIYGPYDEKETEPDGTYRIRGLRLESLDLAPADRAALKLGGQFAITAQMEQQETETEDTMSLTKEQVLAELTVDDIPEVLREQIEKELAADADLEKLVAELKQQATDKDAIIGTLQGQLETKQAAEFEAQLDAKVAELVDWQVEGDEAKDKVAAFRRQIRTSILSELGENRDAEKLAEAAEVVWAGVKPLAEMIRDALAGPPARVSGKVRDKRKLEDTPEARQRARAQMGL